MINRFNLFFSLSVLLYICLPIFNVYQVLGNPLIGIDDSIIFFIYAKNFAHGHGIVYNLGGEHVEGFTSLLYFLVCSLFYCITDHPQKFLIVYNFFLVSTSALMLLKTLKTLSLHFNLTPIKEYLSYWIILLWLMVNPLYYHWSVISLMDIGTYLTLITMTFCYFISILFSQKPNTKKEKWIISTLILLVLLCRPEGMLWGVIYLGVYFIIDYQREKNFLHALKALVSPTLSFSMGLSALTTFRQLYFGYPLPNTYYAKVSGSFTATLQDGVQYFYDFIHLYSAFALVTLLLLIGWTFYLFFTHSPKSSYLYLSLITIIFVTVGLAIPTLEGGDHFNGMRLYQPVYPLLIFPFLLLTVFVSSKKMAVGCFSLCLIWIGFNQTGWKEFKKSENLMNVGIEYNIARIGLNEGKHLNEIFQKKLPSIGFAAAGGIAYSYHGFVYDVLGLNNTYFAHAETIKTGYKGHQSFNKQVFLTLAPDIFIPLTNPSRSPFNLAESYAHFHSSNTWDSLIFKNIFNDLEFNQQYVLATVLNLEHPNYQCQGFFNRHYLATLNPQSYKIEMYP